MAIASLGPRSGTVSSFDADRGLGEVTDDRGATIPFHCTAIADGSRDIEVGRPVRFQLVAGRLGRWEAGSIVPA